MKIFLILIILFGCDKPLIGKKIGENNPFEKFKCGFEYIDVEGLTVFTKICKKFSPDGTEVLCSAFYLEQGDNKKPCKNKKKKNCVFFQRSIYWTDFMCTKGLKNEVSPVEFKIPWQGKNPKKIIPYSQFDLCVEAQGKYTRLLKEAGYRQSQIAEMIYPICSMNNRDKE